MLSVPVAKKDRTTYRAFFRKHDSKREGAMISRKR